MDDFPVLGLLGPAGIGKDLVADWFVEKHNFIKLAFADPMKRFVSRAFSLDHDKLWGPSEERNRMFEITDNWWYEVIGHFGDASSEIVNSILTDDNHVEGYLKLHDWLTGLRKAYPTKISARIILQTLGTEWGRSVDPLMWVKYAFKVVNFIMKDPVIHDYVKERGPCLKHAAQIEQDTPSCEGVIISDVRFRNEVTFAQEQGAYVLRLRRPEYEKSILGSDIGVKNHQSEAEQKELPDKLFDAVYELPEGIDKVITLLETTYPDKPWARKWDKTSEHECNIVCLNYPPVSTPIV